MVKGKLGLFLLLTVIRAGSAVKPTFTFKDQTLTATEGSCVPIEGTFTGNPGTGGYWIWLKDPVWVTATNDYSGTVVHSTDPQRRPISPDYIDRVSYREDKKQFTIKICDLNRNDGGQYSFRYFQSTNKWSSGVVRLTVEENPCLISFEEPAPVAESHSVTLRCSTPSSCHSVPQIKTPSNLERVSRPYQVDTHSTAIIFTARVQDHGKWFTCKTEGYPDQNLRRVALDVRYKPRNVEAKVMKPKWRSAIVEKDSVTLTCSASGNPAPTYSWLFHNRRESQDQNYTIHSIKASQSGRYSCEATNDKGHESSSVDLQVNSLPEVKITASATSIKEGDRMVLECTLMGGFPKPTRFEWKKDQQYLTSGQKYTSRTIHLGHAGSYTCSARNSIGTGTSAPLQIHVEYRPKNMRVHVPSGPNSGVSAGKPLILTCQTDAYPAPYRFTWSRSDGISQTECTHFKEMSWIDTMTIDKVQRSDEGCYKCEATNSIGSEQSGPECFTVQYMPSNLKMTIDTQVTQGQAISITCSVDSFPTSTLTLVRETGSSSVNVFAKPHTNYLVYTTDATANHAGRYKCVASNSEGTTTSAQRELVVRYSPMDVLVHVHPSRTVKENTSVTLKCSAHSYPAVTSVTLTKMTDGLEKVLTVQSSFTLRSVSPSDSGQYRCKASNEVGSGESKVVNIQVEYAPKETKILKAEEKQLLDNKRSVMLTCNSPSYPKIHQYSWYMKSADGGKDARVSTQQNHTVTSDKPGTYYCSADNKIGQKTSDPVEIFLEGTVVKVLKYFLLTASLLLIPLAACLIYKWKWKSKQGAAEGPQEVQSGPLEEASVNYAAVHFTKRQPDQDVVYAVVSKPGRPNKPDNTNDYEEEEDLNYSFVQIVHKPERQVFSLGEENTEYSMIKTRDKKTGLKV